jgi:GNAT superfamily N-acetyltransferase
LQRLHGRLSDSTIDQRFHGPKPQLDEVWARRFAELDGHTAAAFVATTGTHGPIVGVARYYKIGATTTAEVAFVVEDAYQGCGLGTRLMKRLREQALRNGITEFVALLLPRNERMLRLLRAVGPTQIRVESGTVDVQVSISPAKRRDARQPRGSCNGYPVPSGSAPRPSAFWPATGARNTLSMENAHSTASTIEHASTARRSPTYSDAIPTPMTGIVEPA